MHVQAAAFWVRCVLKVDVTTAEEVGLRTISGATIWPHRTHRSELGRGSLVAPWCFLTYASCRFHGTPQEVPAPG